MNRHSVIIIPDSFKGTMTAIEVCDVISGAIRDRYPQAQITGEGQLDEQSLRGKVVMTVASHAKAGHVPVIAVVGNTAGNYTPIYGYGIKKIIRTMDFCEDPEHYERTCRDDLYQAIAGMEVL